MVFALVATHTAAAAPRMGARAFSVSMAAKKDLVQEAYLRELKAYKPTPKAADAHKGQVREFASPKSPQAPAVPSSSDLSSELSAFSSAEPDHASAADRSAEGASAAAVAPELRQDVNAFLEEAKKPYEVEVHH